MAYAHAAAEQVEAGAACIQGVKAARGGDPLMSQQLLCSPADSVFHFMVWNENWE